LRLRANYFFLRLITLRIKIAAKTPNPITNPMTKPKIKGSKGIAREEGGVQEFSEYKL